MGNTLAPFVGADTTHDNELIPAPSGAYAATSNRINRGKFGELFADLIVILIWV